MQILEILAQRKLISAGWHAFFSTHNARSCLAHIFEDLVIIL